MHLKTFGWQRGLASCSDLELLIEFIHAHFNYIYREVDLSDKPSYSFGYHIFLSPDLRLLRAGPTTSPL